MAQLTLVDALVHSHAFPCFVTSQPTPSDQTRLPLDSVTTRLRVGRRRGLVVAPGPGQTQGAVDKELADERVACEAHGDAVGGVVSCV